jgi:hypothetical protein
MSLYRLEVDPLDLGADVKAVGLELMDPQTREPARGGDAARIWAATIPALAGAEPWTLDFFSHLARVRDYCTAHQIPFRDAAVRTLIIPAPAPEKLSALLERFAGETFGARAGAGVTQMDAELEGELSRRGVDGYHAAYPRYSFCGVCDFENGFLTLITNRLWAGEVLRRLTPALKDLAVRVQVPG